MSDLGVSPVNQDVRKLVKECAKARKKFTQKGESIARWAVSRGYSPAMAQAVLAGKLPCVRGEAHRIAVDLGLKTATDDQVGA